MPDQELNENHLTKGSADPFLPGTYVQWAWDSTCLGLIKTCPRLYQYTMIDGYVAKGESIHLRFGIEYHQALQDYDIARAEGIIHGESNLLSQGTTEMYRAQVGYPIGYFYGDKTAGVFQNGAEVAAAGATLQKDPQPGDLIFVDNNGDGSITVDDKTMIGNPHPDVTLGFSFNMAYKGFDLSVTTNGAFGQQIAKSYRSFADSKTQNFTLIS